MEDNMKVIVGLTIGIAVFVVMIMSLNVVGGSVDDTIKGIDGKFTVTFDAPPMDGDTISITFDDRTETYEFDTDGSITPGNIRIVPAPH